MPITDSTVVKIPGLVELYTTTLQERGYGPVATHAYKRAVEHFIAWSAPDSECVEIGEAAFRRFFDGHLGDCSCAGRPQRGKVTALSALRHLQAILRATGSIPPAPPSFPSFVISELQDYCDFANDVCGLAPATLISRRKWIGRFLTHIFPAGDLQFSLLGPKGVRDFFATQCQGYQPGSAQVVASSVRSYLRFRALRHADSVEALMAAIPQAVCWRLASLPDHLSREELAKLMSVFEQADPQRQRDYAIVRCLVDLGLRSLEVAALRLEDIDWKNATLTVRSGKSHRVDVLPLPAVTGHAIANYLRKARPETGNQSGHREIVVWVWHPAIPRSGAEPAGRMGRTLLVGLSQRAPECRGSRQTTSVQDNSDARLHGCADGAEPTAISHSAIRSGHGGHSARLRGSHRGRGEPRVHCWFSVSSLRWSSGDSARGPRPPH